MPLLAYYNICMTIDEFRNVDLRVGKILEATRVDGSEKLLKLQIDLGEEKRQVLAGIGKVYEPDSLIGREVVIVANLEPRVMMGLESRGMLLAAGTDSGPVFLTPEKEVPPGSKIS